MLSNAYLADFTDGEIFLCVTQSIYGTEMVNPIEQFKVAILHLNKKRIRFENTPRRIPTSHMPEFILWQVHRQVTRLSWVNGTPH